MQLIGMLDSPFVRRVAVTMRLLGVEYEHRPLSVLRTYDEFRAVNPLVKVPTLVLDNGEVLVESTLIINYLESQIAGRSLMPTDSSAYLTSMQQIGTALIAKEKIVALIYETAQRPEELQHQPWIDRVRIQLSGALDLIEADVKKITTEWLHGDQPGQADITTAIMWRFSQHIDCAQIEANQYPALSAFAARAEALPEFLACPMSG